MKAQWFRPRRAPLTGAVLAILGLLPAAAVCARDASPAGLIWTQVTSCDDSGPGTLRQAVADAPPYAGIDLGQLPCVDHTIHLTSGAISFSIDGPMLINGVHGEALATPTATAPPVTIDAGGMTRVFEHNGAGRLMLKHVALRNGHWNGAGGCLASAGDVSLYDVTVSGCHVEGAAFGDARGGGLSVAGSAEILWSRITDNSVVDDSFADGGGIAVVGALVMGYSTVSGNEAIGGAFGFGGGVYANSDADLSNSTISGNQGTTIGGLDLVGFGGTAALRMANCTVSGNTGASTGGMLALQSQVTVASSTIAFNMATSSSGIGGLNAAQATLQSSLLAANTGWDLGVSCIAPPCSATIAGADNLVMTWNVDPPGGTISADPLLLPLSERGGPTATHALGVGSPAIDHGNAIGAGGGALSFDQRGAGFERIVGAAADIGAFETGAGPDWIFIDGFDGIQPLPAIGGP